MNKIIKNIALFLLTISLIACSATYFGNVLRPIETDINVVNIETFQSLPKDSLDVILLGSSRMWRGINTMELYDKYGIGAYNIGCNWQHINTTNLFLHDALKRQTPKVVVIDATNAHLPLMDVDMDGEIYYTEKIPWSYTKYRCVRQYFGRGLERYFSYFVPLCAFHENWQNVSADNFNDENINVDFLKEKENVDENEFYRTMGFGNTDIVTKVKIKDYKEFEQRPFEKYATDVLDDIVNTCNQNNVKILFVTIPFEGESNYINAMDEYAKQKGCDYINLYAHIDEIGLNFDADFGDPSHLNTSGATKIADFIGAYMEEKYELTDFRTIQGNQWEKNANK